MSKLNGKALQEALGQTIVLMAIQQAMCADARAQKLVEGEKADEYALLIAEFDRTIPRLMDVLKVGGDAEYIAFIQGFIDNAVAFVSEAVVTGIIPNDLQWAKDNIEILH